MAEISIPAPDAAGYWHFTYITTDTLDGSWYGGKRSCKKHPSSDPYLGSGNWVRKHPERKRLKREIVAFFTTSKEVYAAEADMITWAMVSDDPLCMNLWAGGQGMTVEGARRRSEDPEWQEAHGARLRRMHADPEWRVNHAAGCRMRSATPKWIKNHAAGIAKRTADPIWRENVITALLRKAADPAWREAAIARIECWPNNPDWAAAHAAGIKKRSADPVWRANVTAGAQKRSADPVWLENNAAARRRNPLRPTQSGEGNPNAKLTWTDVAAIRISTDASSILAKRYAVSRSAIKNIRSRRTWAQRSDGAITRALPLPEPASAG